MNYQNLYILLSIIIFLIIILIILLFILLDKNNSKVKDIIDHRLDEFRNENNSSIANSFTILSSSISNQQQQATQDIHNQFSTMSNQLNASQKMEEIKLENIRQTMINTLDSLQKTNTQKLEEMRKTVDEKLKQTLETTLSNSLSLVNNQLEQVHKGLGEMQNLAIGVGDLKKVLSNVKTRGILGEIQLGNILKDILASNQYDENVATVPNSKERVEFAIKLPANDNQTIYLPIDSKFPLDTYNRYQEAINSNDKNKIDDAKKELTNRLKSEAKDIHNKYISVPYTTEFAIMFLPTEGLYADACNLGMLEMLQKEYKVTIAGPGNMAALLNCLQMGFKTLTIQKRSSEVWELLSSIKKEFETFQSVLDKAQEHIQQTSDDLEKLVGVRTRQINKKLLDVQINTEYLTESKMEEK